MLCAEHGLLGGIVVLRCGDAFFAQAFGAVEIQGGFIEPGLAFAQGLIRLGLGGLFLGPLEDKERAAFFHLIAALGSEFLKLASDGRGEVDELAFRVAGVGVGGMGGMML